MTNPDAPSVPEPYAISVSLWGRNYFNVSEATAYRIINGETPPPLMILNGRQKVAVGSEKYQQWLASRTVFADV